MPPTPTTLSIYFPGTTAGPSFPFETNPQSQGSEVYTDSTTTDESETNSQSQRLEDYTADSTAIIEGKHYKFAFPGCAQRPRQITVANGELCCTIYETSTLGLLFGASIDKQCEEAKNIVYRFLREINTPLVLNIIGSSRGGIAALILAKQLGDFDSYHLQTNLFLLDPVPGNSWLAFKLDFFGLTLASQAMSVANSHNLNHVFAFYRAHSINLHQNSKTSLYNFFSYVVFPNSLDS